MDDVHEFCEMVVSSSVWKTLFPSRDVWKVPPLKPGRGARTAHVLWHHDGRIEIAFPRAYRFATYVLHELAHYGLGLDESIAAHGPEFVGLWMALVREFCSVKTVHALERAIVREKVKMYIPVERSVTTVIHLRDPDDVPIPKVVNGDHQMKLFA